MSEVNVRFYAQDVTEMTGDNTRSGVVGFAMNYPLPNVRQSLWLAQSGATLVDWDSGRPVPVKALADLYDLPLDAIDWQTALEPPADLSPGHWIEPEQPAPGAPTGYVTLLATIEPGWRANLPSVIVPPRRFWFGETGELLGQVEARPMLLLMANREWQQYQAFKHGGENDCELIEWQLRSLPREYREELLRKLPQKARGKPGNKREHDHELMIAEVWNAIDHRDFGIEEALRKVAVRHRVSREWVRQLVDDKDRNVWVSLPMTKPL
jgi:hypothetical protein